MRAFIQLTDAGSGATAVVDQRPIERVIEIPVVVQVLIIYKLL